MLLLLISSLCRVLIGVKKGFNSDTDTIFKGISVGVSFRAIRGSPIKEGVAVDGNWFVLVSVGLLVVTLDLVEVTTTTTAGGRSAATGAVVSVIKVVVVAATSVTATSVTATSVTATSVTATAVTATAVTGSISTIRGLE